MKTSSAKAKGRSAQNAVAALIKDHIESQVGITLDPRDVGVAIMGTSGVDIKLSPLAEKYFPWSVEVKNQEALNIWGALKQAETNCLPNTKPMLVFKRNRSPLYVVMKAEDYFQVKTK